MGLLDFTPSQSDSLLDFGAGLLSASGPSRMPVSFGQAFGAGMQGMRQGDQQRLHSRMLGGQMQLQQMQIDSAKISDARKKSFEQMLPMLSPTVQQAYMMAGPEKAYEAMQAENDAKEFRQMMGGGSPVAAPRPYQGQVSGAFQIDTPEQKNQLQSDYAMLAQINPEEAAKVREALIQQGAINAPMQSAAGPTPEQIGMFAAQRAYTGRKGGDTLMKLAEMQQPNVGVLDNGGSNLMYDKNSGRWIGSPIAKGMSPEAMASNQLGWANNDIARFNAQKPTYHDGALVGPDGSITKTPMYSPPKGTPEATAQASSKVLPLLDEANRLLNSSTGSYGGAAYDEAARVFGQSTKGAQAAAQLKALEGALMMAQPRMEGPQSDKDVALYRQMAGQIGDSTVPIETRRAALQGVKAMHEKYASPQSAPKSTMSSGGWSATLVK